MSETPPSERDVEVVSRHLPSGYSAGPDVLSEDRSAPSVSVPDLTSAREQSSLKLQGGDVHRDLYKLDARAKVQQRSHTFSQPSTGGSAISNFDGASSSEQQMPGGFRRQYLQRRPSQFDRMTLPITKDFVSFLDLYGGFAGEDLFDSDSEAIESDEDDDEAPEEEGPSERRPLLGRRKSSKRASKPGEAGTTRTFFTLLKAFVGTGIMFLPKAFNNGGILFSSITLIVVSVLSCICFYMLLQCRKRYGGSYGELGEAIGGPKLRYIILASITISQIGFVCAGIIFTAENLYSFLDAVTKGPIPLSTTGLIAIQLIVLIPLSLIRNISKLGSAALLADVFILIGLTYIYWFDISTIAQNGLHPTVRLFNPSHYTLTVGSAIFTFEGIGLILPIQSSMAKPEKFSTLLYIVMFIITIIFTSVGALSYATFGDHTMTEVISNFPQDSKVVNAVQFLYSLAVLVGTPVQLFPAVRIMEAKLFGQHSGKRDPSTKWKKNAFRTAIVFLSGAISALGASDLDKFVALIGSFACVPLVYIYPALLHYKGIAEGRVWKVVDVLMMLVGSVAMVYTTAITVARWTEE